MSPLPTPTAEEPVSRTSPAWRYTPTRKRRWICPPAGGPETALRHLTFPPDERSAELPVDRPPRSRPGYRQWLPAAPTAPTRAAPARRAAAAPAPAPDTRPARTPRPRPTAPAGRPHRDMPSPDLVTASHEHGTVCHGG